MKLVRRAAAPAMVKEEERALRAKTAQERKFAEKYDRLFPRLCDYVARAMGRADAEDIVQNAVYGVWERWPVIEMDNPGQAYFFRAVRNAVVDAVRERQPEAAARILDVEIEDVEGGPVPDAVMEAKERVRALDAAIARMPQRVREAWILVRDNECSYHQAAEVMGVQYNTLRNTLAYANQLVREAMTDAGYLEAARKRRALPPTTEGNQP
jgi:RNA polymerase sigma-70 factor (ECF subfamily)